MQLSIYAIEATLKEDITNPLRLVYWSAIELQCESQRLEKEYTKLLIRLRLCKMLGQHIMLRR